MVVEYLSSTLLGSSLLVYFFRIFSHTLDGSTVFDEILDMIPASYYYPDKQQELSHKFMFNKNGEQNTGVKQKRKSKSKKAARPNASSQELQIKVSWIFNVSMWVEAALCVFRICEGRDGQVVVL